MEMESKMNIKIKDCVLIEAFKCNENDSVVEVAKKFKSINLRHIFVVDKNDSPIGVISVIDIINRVVANDLDANNTKAHEIMTKPIVPVDLNEDVKTYFDKMIKTHHVMEPVIEHGKMIGIITLHQLIKNLENKK